MSSTYGHGPLAEHADPAAFGRLIQHLDNGDLRFAGCRGDCGQGDRPCKTPGRCFIVPAEASTEIGSDGEFRGEGAGAILWPLAVVAVGIIGAALWAAFK